MVKRKIILLLIVSLLFSCSVTKNNKNKSFWVEKKAKQLYDKYELKYNNDSSFVIIQTDNKQDLIPNYKIKFSVFDLNDKKIVMQREMNNTAISWFSDTKILAKTQLGYVDKKTNKSFKTFIINVLE